MAEIKIGDIVRVNVKLTATAVGHDVRCEYIRPADGSTRPVYIPAEIMEVVGAKAEEKKPYKEPEKITPGTGKTVYECGVCGKTYKAASCLSRHKRTHKQKRG